MSWFLWGVITFSFPALIIWLKKNPQKFCSAADHSSEHSFRTEASGHSQAHGDLRPAGASPLLRAPQLTAQWHAGNSSYQLERRWWTEHLIFLLFLSNRAQTCMQSVSCQPDSAENIAFLWCNSWSKDLRKSFCFFSQLWLICKPAELPFIHTETVSLLYVVFDCWGKDSGWLRSTA